MSKLANMLHLDNPFGIIVIYLGFGAGLSTFMFSGFVKSIPVDIERSQNDTNCDTISQRRVWVDRYGRDDGHADTRDYSDYRGLPVVSEVYYQRCRRRCGERIDQQTGGYVCSAAAAY